MKKYEIPSASKLKEAILLMKNPAEAHKVQSVATVWSVMERKGFQKHLHLHIELGRKAQLFRRTNTEVLLLGDMHLGKTRDFVKGLSEIEDS